MPLENEDTDNVDVILLDNESSGETENIEVVKEPRRNSEIVEFEDNFFDFSVYPSTTQSSINDDNILQQPSTSRQFFNQDSRENQINIQLSASKQNLQQPSTSRTHVPPILTPKENLPESSPLRQNFQHQTISTENLSQPSTSSQSRPTLPTTRPSRPHFASSRNTTQRPVQVLPRAERSDEFPTAKRKRFNTQITHENERRELITTIRDSLAAAATPIKENKASEEGETAASIGKSIEIRLRHWRQDKQFKAFDAFQDIIRKIEMEKD